MATLAAIAHRLRLVLLFLVGGLHLRLEEARAWRLWLLRAVAGDPAELQVIYGVAGERGLTEWIAEWLPGYEGVPVRIGNAAAKQFQLDVYREVVDAFHQARAAGLETDKTSWALVSYVEVHWQDPDEGIWEVRSGRRPSAHSRAMAWVAPDAAVLLLPLVGLIDATDQRMVNTVEAVERELTGDGFLKRYAPAPRPHRRAPAWVKAPFWPAASGWPTTTLQGRYDEARNLFERLLALRSDLGLLSEEHIPSPAAWSATSLKPSVTSPSSTPPVTFRPQLLPRLLRPSNSPAERRGRS